MYLYIYICRPQPLGRSHDLHVFSIALFLRHHRGAPPIGGAARSLYNTIFLDVILPTPKCWVLARDARLEHRARSWKHASLGRKLRSCNYPETRSSTDTSLHGTLSLGIRRADMPTCLAFYPSARRLKMKYHGTNVALRNCSLEMRRDYCFVR